MGLKKINGIYERAWNYSLFYLQFRPRSIKELKDQLKKKGYLSSTIEKVTNRLRELQLLDDKQFAKLWSQKRLQEGRGEYLIKRELARKGITQEVALQAVKESKAELPPASERLEEMISRKIKTMKNLSPNISYRRLAGYLMRRGFEWDTVKNALKQHFRGSSLDESRVTSHEPRSLEEEEQ